MIPYSKKLGKKAGIISSQINEEAVTSEWMKTSTRGSQEEKKATDGLQVPETAGSGLDTELPVSGGRDPRLLDAVEESVTRLAIARVANGKQRP